MFTFVVEDVFAIKGRGVVVSGRYSSGQKPQIGTAVLITAADRPPVRSVITGRSLHDFMHSRPPEDVDAFLLRGASKEDVPIGSGITVDPSGPE